MHFSYYKMNLLREGLWHKSKAILGKHILNSDPTFIRNKWSNGIDIKNGGWHFSY